MTENFTPTFSGGNRSFETQIGIPIADGSITRSKLSQDIKNAIDAIPAVDSTLSTAGSAADAKATGDAVANVVSQIPAIDSTLSVSGKAADAKAVGDELALTIGSIPEVDNTLSVPGAAADAKAVGDALALKVDNELFNEKILSKYETVYPTNWLNKNALTDGVLKANGTIESTNNRCYTDFIPVNAGDHVQIYRWDTGTAQYKRNVCCYDANKSIVSSSGTDSAASSAFTIPNGISFVRITIAKDILDYNIVIVKDGTNPPTYTEYFTPYDSCIEDFVTPQSEAVISKLIENNYKTSDLVNRYACDLLKGYPLRQTVGLPQSWYYYNMVSPLTPVAVYAGAEYLERDNDKITFPNETSLNSLNGHSFYVYDSLLSLLDYDRGAANVGRERKIITENLSSCTVLVIGDSTVDQDTMTQKMLDYFTNANKTLTLLGTLGSGNNKNEGRAGWKATDYLTNRQYDSVTNPFYNQTSETFDFEYYMTNQNYSTPDFVVIQLGINDLYNGDDTNITSCWNAIKTMCDSIISYDNSIRIVLNLPTSPNSDQSKHTGFLPMYNNRRIKYNQYAIQQAISTYGQTKVRPSYCHLILNPATDINDNVHPTNVGYEKMAKEIINQINCWQNNA